MRQNLLLQITSLLSILFVTFHLTSDTLNARVGSPEAGGSTLMAVPILVLWLCGTLLFPERRSGHIVMLVGGLIAIAMPYFHVVGSAGVFHGTLASSSGPFLFVWSFHVLGITGLFTLILATIGLLRMRRAH
jgi:hypothetical protein